MTNLGLQHQNLDQQAYVLLKEMITQRKLLPGEKIRQEQLARDLGISRTPLVSALKYLEREKLVEAKPRRGFFVRHFSLKEMVSIFELREVLEGLAARRAATHIDAVQIKTLKTFFSEFSDLKEISDTRGYAQEDRRFHIFVTEVGSKEFLKSILQSYNIISFSYQVVTSEGLVRPPEETIREHLTIIDAICRKDPEAAEKRMRQHFQATIERLAADIASKEQPVTNQPIQAINFAE